ncbi:hypothetical protein HALLA_13555 [Halostagnicola larsenii XH-48]|uniref:Uncharacterized protein n=1 Tax=Halostagnicola larsenii XH-48 TaxID=797299 RepID=W0JVF0_9EURY|nr:hypothetical protein HALLA_13555 [Halostagnicola larsenii XH-48]
MDSHDLQEPLRTVSSPVSSGGGSFETLVNLEAVIDRVRGLRGVHGDWC